MTMANHGASAKVDDGLGAPFFSFGFERSGTTLLAMMLGSHPALAVPFSTAGMWYRYYDALADYNHLRTKEDTRRLLRHMLADERIGMWDVTFDQAMDFEDVGVANFPSLVQRIHSTYARLKDKKMWGNVDILTLERMDTALSWFPKARFIHIVRDGRDIALSHDSYAYGATNTLECAESWHHKVHTNLKMGAMLDRSQYLVIRYEDLVLETERTLSTLCAFLGVEYSASMLDYPHSVAERIPESRRALWPLITSNPRSDNAFRWKQHMSLTRRIVFERSASLLLRRLDYETLQPIPRRPMSLVFEFFCLLDRGHRFRRLARRFRSLQTQIGFRSVRG